MIQNSPVLSIAINAIPKPPACLELGSRPARVCVCYASITEVVMALRQLTLIQGYIPVNCSHKEDRDRLLMLSDEYRCTSKGCMRYRSVVSQLNLPRLENRILAENQLLGRRASGFESHTPQTPVTYLASREDTISRRVLVVLVQELLIRVSLRQVWVVIET